MANQLFTKEEVGEIKSKFDNEVLLNRCGVLDEMMPLIVEKRKKQVSVERIAEWMNEHGIKITARALYYRLKKWRQNENVARTVIKRELAASSSTSPTAAKLADNGFIKKFNDL